MLVSSLLTRTLLLAGGNPILQERSAACQQMIRGLMKHLRTVWPRQRPCARYDLPSWFTITSN